MIDVDDFEFGQLYVATISTIALAPLLDAILERHLRRYSQTV